MRSALALMLVFGCTAAAAEEPAPIDMPGFLRVASEAAQHRESRLVDEAAFLRLRARPGTLVVDARSAERYAEMHVDGALNLSFPDIAEASLAALLPDKEALILIYCNNNFRNSERAFPSKLPSASLNLSTYVALYDYGYRNVYELEAWLDPATTQLPMVGTVAPASDAMTFVPVGD